MDPREVGSYEAGQDGPLFIAVGGLHGNELAGLRAIERVLEVLQGLPLRGRFIGLRGNTRALAAGRRFVARDLNRTWTRAGVAEALDGGELDAEGTEMRELLADLHDRLAGQIRPAVIVDLHSTSGEGAPFSVGADVLRNRPALLGLGIPVVLGLEEVIDGSLAGFLCDFGHAAIGIEAGLERDPKTIDLHVAALLGVMAAHGMLDEIPDGEAHRERLHRAASDCPPVLEIIHRQALDPDDDFEMEPGWRSFQPVARGQVVAADRNGPVRSPVDGRLLLPRYQKQGADGFFIARPVRRFWLGVSKVARRLGLDRTLRLLPGVDRDGGDPDNLIARGVSARLLAPDLFHLFGYRRSHQTEGGRVFMRRQPDAVGVRPPPRP